MADELSAPSGVGQEISALIRRRSEIRDEIVRSRKVLRTLAEAFQQVDVAIRDLNGNAPAARAAPATSQNVGPLTRIVLDALNEAEAPMTSKAIALRVMEDLGLDARDKALLKHIVRRVCVTLWMQVQKGYLRKAEPTGWPLRWERIRAPQ